MKPKIELKNLKYAAFASEETSCFEATVYVDGKRFCIASNEGRGGCDSYEALPPKGGYFESGEEAGAARRQLDHDIHAVGLRHNPNALEKYPEGGFDTEVEPWEEDSAKRHAKWEKEMAESAEVTTYQVFEHLVGNALVEALCRKDMRGAFRRKWLYRKPDGGLYECKKKPADTAAGMAEALADAIPGSVLLNGLPEAEALKIWMEQA
jgi:hypothetical protein